MRLFEHASDHLEQKRGSVAGVTLLGATVRKASRLSKVLDRLSPSHVRLQPLRGDVWPAARARQTKERRNITVGADVYSVHNNTTCT